jgi:hypothetical protein
VWRKGDTVHVPVPVATLRSLSTAPVIFLVVSMLLNVLFITSLAAIHFSFLSFALQVAGSENEIVEEVRLS